MKIILVLSLALLCSCSPKVDRPWEQWYDEKGQAKYFLKVAYATHPEFGYPKHAYVPQTTFPTHAFWESKDGWVELELSIDRNGRVTLAKVVQSEPEKIFDQFATRHFYATRYVPFEKNGEAVDVESIRARINYTLDRSQSSGSNF